MAVNAGAPDRQFLAARDAQPPFFVGVDIGGSAVKLGVVDDLGRPLSWLSRPTDVAAGPTQAVRQIGAAIEESIARAGLEKARLAAVGVGIPGTIDRASGHLLMAANFPGWQNFPIRDRLSQACSLPVSLTNDAAAAGYGEFWVGSGRTLSSMVLLTLGTGVGGAIVIGDLSIDGQHGAGAELGHTIIDYNETARPCSCGRRGHLEAYASAPAVIRRTEELLAARASSTLAARLSGGEALSPLLVAEEAEKGDRVALEIVLDTARYVAIAVVNAMHTIDPSGVVIGGAMTFGGPGTALGRRFLERIRELVRLQALAGLAEQTTIDFAALGPDAGYIGAAGIARRAVRNDKGGRTKNESNTST